MFAGFKIIADVVAYRLRKLEMANLAAAVSIAMALHLTPLDVVIRALFTFALNILVYLNNDYIDVEIDLNSADKDNAKARFLADNLRAAFWAQWGLVAALAVVALLYDYGLFVPLVIGGGVCWWYSAQLKHRPYLDIVAMIIWGVTMPMVGVPLGSLVGVVMALQLGLFSGVFETIQVMRDADEDAEEGVQTTGVVLGKERSLMLARVQMVGVSLYALLMTHPIAAVISAAALAIPFSNQAIEQYWTRIKLTYGIAWLSICAFVWYMGHTSGLLAAFGTLN